jgi:oxygen-independent coproporphyrinogen-3 oxidase
VSALVEPVFPEAAWPERAHGTWGAYVHVPWCRRRCPYCAFYVEVDRITPWGPFVDALIRQRDALAAHPSFPGRPSTVFFGGGTPSRMPVPHLARLLAALAPAPGAEVTLETNPEDVDARWVDEALRAGITRLSLGIQTFSEAHARRLNRACSVGRARRITELVAGAGFETWSLDLIFALPGQTMAELDADLDAVLASGAPHVSIYGLTYEPGTPFERARERGTFAEIDEDRWSEMYDRVIARLSDGGLRRYEVSNFARPGHESRHNRSYWTDLPYLGLGPSAHGYAGPDAGDRWVGPSDVDAWIAAPGAEREQPESRQAAIDLLISALRTPEGLPEVWLAATTGLRVDAPARARLVRQRLLQDVPGRLAATEAGFFVLDGVTEALVEALTLPENRQAP